MQGVDLRTLYRAARSHEGLGGDLTSEGPLTLFSGVLASKGVDFDRLDVEEIHKEI